MQQTTEKHADLMVAAYFSHEVRKAHALFFQNHNSFQQAFESIEKGWENVKKGQAWTAANLTKDKYAAGFCMSYALSYYPLRMKLHPLEHKKWLEEGLTAAEMLKNKNAESTILSYLGTINIALGNPKEAKRYFERALEIAKDEGTKQHECSILLGIASAQADQGEFEEALQNYEKGVDIARGIGDRRNESYILRDWAVLLAELSRFHEALGYFRQALGIAQEIGDIRIVSQILPNMGFIFNQSADFELAQSCFEKAQVILHQIGDKRGEAIVLYSMGMVYSKLNDPSRAIKCLESALLISREIGDKRTESNALSILSEISDEFGIQTSAIDFGDKAQKKWEEIGHSLYANISREKLEKFKNKREEKIIGFSLLFIGLAIVFLGGYFGNNLGGIIGGFLGILGGILVVVTLPIIIGLLWTLFKTIFVLGKWLMFPRSRKINNIDFPVFIVFGILARILSKIIPGLRRRIEKERNTEEVQKASQYLPDRRDEKAFSDAQKKKIKLRFWNILRDIRARIRSEEILPIKTDLPNQELELNNLAMTFYSLGDYDNAIENYKKIISYFREKEDWKGLGITFYNLALAENRNHNRKHSIELAHHSIQILSQINDVETVDIIRKRLGDWYRKGAPDRKKNTAIGFFLLIIFVAFFLGGLIWGFKLEGIIGGILGSALGVVFAFFLVFFPIKVLNLVRRKYFHFILNSIRKRNENLRKWSVPNFKQALSFKGKIVQRLTVLLRIKEVLDIVSEKNSSDVEEIKNLIVQNMNYSPFCFLRVPIRQQALACCISVGETMRPYLLQADYPASPQFHSAVLEAASAIAPESPEVQSILIEASRNPSSQVRKSALNAVGSNFSPWAVGLIQIFVNDPNRKIRKLAKGNLRRLEMMVEEYRRKEGI